MKKTMIAYSLAALALGSASLPAFAHEKVTAPQAQIAFANHGGIRNWQAADNQTIYFQDGQRNWYKATLFAPAPDLPFAIGLGIDTRPMGTLDKWSAVYVGGMRYPFSSFEKVSGPPSTPTHPKA
jgi:hypothetical protein